MSDRIYIVPTGVCICPKLSNVLKIEVKFCRIIWMCAIPNRIVVLHQKAKKIHSGQDMYILCHYDYTNVLYGVSLLITHVLSFTFSVTLVGCFHLWVVVVQEIPPSCLHWGSKLRWCGDKSTQSCLRPRLVIYRKWGIGNRLAGARGSTRQTYAISCPFYGPLHNLLIIRRETSLLEINKYQSSCYCP